MQTNTSNNSLCRKPGICVRKAQCGYSLTPGEFKHC